MGKRGPKPKIINTSWTPELAYVVGVFASDGNLGKDGMYLEITSKDKEVLDNVRKILNIEHIKIGKKKTGHGSTVSRIQFKRVLFHKWLVSLGLTPDKSKSIGVLKIPDRYFFDFLRGVWDGDGSVYAFWDKRWRSSYVYHLNFTSASPDFLKWVQKRVKALTGINGHVSYSARSLDLRYGKRDSTVIFKKMFHKNNLPHIPRKFTKVQKVFRINEHNAKKWHY